MGVQRLGIRNRAEAADVQTLIDEIVEKIESRDTYGSGAPTSITKGFKYTDEDTAFTYTKIGDNWIKNLT